MPPNQPATRGFHYRFKRSNGEVRDFHLNLDAQTLSIVNEKPKNPPDWTRLSYFQCANCPLKESEHPHCPVAVNLVDVISAFSDCHSYETVEVEIESDSRRFAKTVPLTEGIRSVLGLYMAVSGCPILDRLKPLVRTHLPFATWDETAFRVIGAYLLGQYFIAKKGGEPDWELKNLVTFYDEVKVVNNDFCRRLRSFCLEDAPLNAVIELDSLADMMSLLIRKDRMDGLRQMLTTYLDTSEHPKGP